jgi:hypothetical protein
MTAVTNDAASHCASHTVIHGTRRYRMSSSYA